MIKKIIRINNIGCFANESGVSEVEFKKMNLIYGGNGSGKTTLSSILRSIKNNDAKYLQERKNLDNKNNIKIEMRINNEDGNLKFSNNNWSDTQLNLEIFDQEFIDKNVYSGSIIDNEHKKNITQVILGEKGINIVDEIEKIKKGRSEISEKIRNKEKEIKDLDKNILEVNSFIELEKDENIEIKISNLQKNIKNSELIFNQYKKIESEKELQKISVIDINDDINNVINTTFENIENKAIEFVKKHIEANLKKSNENWINEGLDLTKGNDCPYCGQSILDMKLIEYYRLYFGEEYKNLKKDIINKKKIIENSFSETLTLKIQNIIKTNLHLNQFWNDFVEKDNELVIDVDKFDITRKKYYEYALKLLEEKEKSPLIKENELKQDGKGEKELSKLTISRNELLLIINNYNDSIQLINEEINCIKSKKINIEKINELKKQLNQTNMIKIRYEKNSENLIEEFSILKKEMNELIVKNKKKQKELKEYSDEMGNKFGDKVNDMMCRFGTDYSIKEINQSFQGYTPKTNYKLNLKNHEINLDNNERKNPCFRTILSTGDKFALALSFFLASLEKLEDKIIVFDDPFNSLDSFRRGYTIDKIVDVLSNSKQVIVLSHNEHFLYGIYSHCSLNKDEIEQFELKEKEGNIMLLKWDIINSIKDVYSQNYDIMINYYNNEKGERINVVRTIRPYLEGWLRKRYKGYFLNSDSLGDCIHHFKNKYISIRNKLISENDYQELINIHNFSRKYHHDISDNKDNERIDKNDLKSYIQRTLELTKSKYKD